MKKKNYKEALLWAIIIILMVFIIALDAIWFRENHIEKVNQEDSQQATYVEVYFDFNGGTGNTSSRSMSGTYNFDGINATRAGYTFAGWMYNGEYVNHGDTLKSNSDHTLVAQWTSADINVQSSEDVNTSSTVGINTQSSEDTGVQVTLNFNTGYIDNGSSKDYGPRVVTMYDVYNIPTLNLVNPGYTFKGWFYKVDGAQMTYTVSTGDTLRSNSDHAIYAEWKEDSSSDGDSSYITVTLNYTAANKTSSSKVPIREKLTYGDFFAGTMPDIGTSCKVNDGTSTGRTLYLYGWRVNNSTSGRFVSQWDELVSYEDQTLYAQWAYINFSGNSSDTFYVTFDYNDGTNKTEKQSFSISKSEVLESVFFYSYKDMRITFPTPTRAGYKFLGWYYSDSSLTKETDYPRAFADHTLTAKWEEAPVYKFTFDKQGGSGGADAIWDFYEQAYYKDEACTDMISSSNPISIPSRSGYIFGGYYTQTNGGGNQVINESGVLGTGASHWAENKTLYAKWTPITYTVAYNGNGATGGSTGNSSHTYDVAKNLTTNGYERKYTVTYNHNYSGSTNTSKTATYTFNGWATVASGAKVYNNSQSVTNLSSTNGATVTLYANWSSTSVSYTPTRTGYIFGGWYKEAGCTNKISDATYTPSSNITVYAKWTPIAYTVAYNGNGATGGSTGNSSHTYDVAKNLTANGYERKYTVTYNHNYAGSTNTSKTATYTFNGWATVASGAKVYNNSQSVTNLSSTNGATVTLYANWSSTSVSYTPTRTGYIFGGWYKEAGCTNKISDATYTPSSNITVYAKWTPINYTVTYNSNKPTTASGTITGSTGNSNHTYDSAKNLTTNGYTLIGWTFAGWNTKEDGTGTSYTNGQEVTNLSNTNGATVTLYAQWTANKYTVIYNSNKPATASASVTGNTADSTHTYDIEISLTKNGYSLTGWTFAGWNTAENGTGTSYADEAKVENQTATNGGKITLYAQWTANKYTVTYNKNNATEFNGDTSKTVTYDTQYGTLPSVKRIYSVVFATNGGTPCVDKTSRYNFEGWYLENQQIIETTYVHTPKNHELTAKWSGGEIELPDTIKEGCNFEGWYNEAGEKVGNAGEKYAPIKDETLFAHYTGKEYTLTVNPNGGQWKESTSKQNIVGRRGNTIVLENPIAPEGNKVIFIKNNGTEDETIIQSRTFLGWETTGVGTINGNQYTYGAGNSEITAKYSSNDEIKLPTAEKTGYTFAGWYSDETLETKVGNAGDSYIPKSNTILYAKWNTNTNTEYKVEYYTEKLDGSYELNSEESYTGTTESSVTAEIKEIAGFEFDENNSSNIKQGNIKADGSLVLKLYYTRKSYTITFNVNEGEELKQNTKQVKYEDNYGNLPEVTKEGYTFDGWYDSKIDGNKITTTTKVEKTENHTIYAHWKINSYTLTINPNGGEYNGYTQSSTYTQEYNSTKEIGTPTKTKAGYKVTFVNIGGESVEPIIQTTEFDTWKLNGAGKLEQIDGKTIYTYGAKDSTITANYTGKDITLPEGIKEGHKFKGWYTSEDIKVGTAGEQYKPNNDITLYAIYDDEYYDVRINPNGGEWKGSKEAQKVVGKYGSSKVIIDPKAPKVHTIKLHMNDGTDTVKDLEQTSTFEGWEIDNGNGTLIGKTYKYGAGEDTLTAIYTENDVELPTVTRTGYTFEGWYKDKEGTEKFGEAGYTYTPTEDGELYAKWIANTYTITFNVNDGDKLENNTKEVIYGEKYGELPTPTRAGYTFMGWFNSVSEEITAETTVDITENTVLTAKWTESELTITFDVYKGQVEPSSKKVIYKQEYGTLPTPTMEGCIFEGWYDSQEQLANRIIDTSIVRKTENHTLYARWKDVQGPKFIYDESNVYEIEVHSEIPEFKVTATDNYDDDVEITVTNNIQKDIVGTYEYTITATDKAGNTTTEKKQFNVVDTTKPIINVKDDVNKYEMEVHTVKPAFLATATDNYDEHIEVVVTDDINVDVVGSYTVTFKATDENGNTATETRSFKVKDTTAPVITPDENNVYEMEVHGEKPEFKATATDNYDEHIEVVVTDDINVDVVGSYTVTFTATDTNGNVAKETREFKVKDTTAPVITPDENNVYEMEVHGTKPEFKATATDNYDEHIEVVVTDNINVDVVGTYTITFTATNTNGNVAKETREFKVKDTTAPVITPDENNVYEMEVHGEKPEFKATATDNYDEHIEVVVTDDINVDVVGSYTVTFTATDTNGNVAKETREFKVKDTTAPVITPDENNVYEMEVHGTKPEFKATATDNYDEHIEVVVTDDINVDVVGSYTVTFTATDTNGNETILNKEFKVLKALPEYEVPTGLKARYFDTLADVQLPEGFSFEDSLETSVGKVGKNIFKVTFTPKDTKNYEIVAGIDVEIEVIYLNIDTDGDGKADLNVDTDGDGKADLNVDTNGDGKADLNIDTDGDGKADLNVDIDGDGKADLNIDTDGNGKPDKNEQNKEEESKDPTNDEDEDIIHSKEDYEADHVYNKGKLTLYSEKYIFGNKYMEYVSNKTTVQALKSWCVTNGTIEVYDKGGMLKKKDTDYVGTGMIFKVTKDEESMSFIIAVQGDTSGDGIVTTTDAAQVEFHILKKKVLEGVEFRASDVNRNKAVTGEDLATIIRKLQYLEPEVVNPNYVEVPEENNETNNAENKDTLEEDTKEDTSNESENKNNTTKENTSKADESKENTNKTEESKDNTIKEETNKTDITKDNKVNETEEKENNSEEKTNLPENNTVQYKKPKE